MKVGWSKKQKLEDWESKRTMINRLMGENEQLRKVIVYLYNEYEHTEKRFFSLPNEEQEMLIIAHSVWEELNKK